MDDPLQPRADSGSEGFEAFPIDVEEQVALEAALAEARRRWLIGMGCFLTIAVLGAIAIWIVTAITSHRRILASYPPTLGGTLDLIDPQGSNVLNLGFMKWQGLDGPVGMFRMDPPIPSWILVRLPDGASLSISSVYHPKPMSKDWGWLSTPISAHDLIASLDATPPSLAATLLHPRSLARKWENIHGLNGNEFSAGRPEPAKYYVGRCSDFTIAVTSPRPIMEGHRTIRFFIWGCNDTIGIAGDISLPFHHEYRDGDWLFYCTTIFNGITFDCAARWTSHDDALDLAERAGIPDAGSLLDSINPATDSDP